MVALQLNLDILSEILSRLRAKHLIKLKSVCKTWLHLISSQEFVKLHLKKSTLRAIHLENAYFIPCPRLFPPPDANYTGQRHVSNPLKCDYPIMVFAGSSSDGLVCLLNQENGIVHIWNPAIRSSACIPINKLRDEEKIQCFWFGLHENEYKLVVGSASSRIHLIVPYSDSYNHGHKSITQQELSRKNYHYEEAVGTLFNDNVHWAVVVRTGRAPPYLAIVWFDLRSGNVGEILLAEVVEEGHFRSFKLGEINGCLCYAIWRGDGLHEVWGMNEYGVKDSSWTKVMVLYTDYVRRFCRDELQEVELEDPMSIKSPFYRKQVYVESLVSPRQGACCRSRFCCSG